MHTPSVRIVDVEGVPQYQLVDGLHRYTAATHAGLTELMVHVVDLDDTEVVLTQVAMNSHTIETKPMQFTKMLKHVLNLNPTMVAGELARRIGKSTQFVKDRLELLRKVQNEQIHALIDEGRITLINAFSLAKLPNEEQLNFLTAAQTEDATTFAERVNARTKEIADAARQSRQPKPTEFVAVAILRKFAELKTAADDANTVARIASQASSVEEAVRLALLYVIKLDPLSVEEQKQVWLDKKAADAKAKEDNKRKHTEAAAAKTAEAAAKASELL
jgi:ParB-like chromosome segregation protein Spo0J